MNSIRKARFSIIPLLMTLLFGSSIAFAGEAGDLERPTPGYAREIRSMGCVLPGFLGGG